MKVIKPDIFFCNYTSVKDSGIKEGYMSFRPRSVEGFKSHRFRSRGKQVSLKPVEGYILFRPQLLFMPAFPPMTTTIPRCPGIVVVK